MPVTGGRPTISHRLRSEKSRREAEGRGFDSRHLHDLSHLHHLSSPGAGFVPPNGCDRGRIAPRAGDLSQPFRGVKAGDTGCGACSPRHTPPSWGSRAPPCAGVRASGGGGESITASTPTGRRRRMTSTGLGPASSPRAVWQPVPSPPSCTTSSARLDASLARRRGTPPAHVVSVRGIPCTDGFQTLVDLAANLDDARWEQALNRRSAGSSRPSTT